MNTLLIVCAIVLFILIVLIICAKDVKNIFIVCCFSIIVNFFFFFFIWLLCGFINMYLKQPTAMDVYRNNVELDISYNINNRGDTISTDSIVVFKKDIKK